jgi:hypothetical protein
MDPVTKNAFKSWVSFSHGSKYEDGCLLGCCIMMMEAAGTAKMLINYQTALHNNPEDSYLHVKECFLRVQENRRVREVFLSVLLLMIFIILY